MLDLELGLGLCFAEPFDDDFGPGPAAHGPPETGAEAEEVPEHCGETGSGQKGLWVCWGRRKSCSLCRVEDSTLVLRSWVWH